MQGILSPLGQVDALSPVAVEAPENTAISAWFDAAPGGGSGIVLPDLVGRYPGALSAAGVAWSPDAPPGSSASLNFAGSGYATIPVNSFPPALPLTIAFWAKYTQTANSVVWEYNSNTFSVQVLAGGGMGLVANFAIPAKTTANWNDGVWHRFLFSLGPTVAECFAYVDGRDDTTRGTLSYNGPSGTGYIGSRGGGGGYVGKLAGLRALGRAASADEAKREYDSARRGYPAALNRDASRVATFQSQPRSLTLSAAAGSYALTGNAATLKAARRLTASAGSYALTGNTAAFLRTRRLTASAGSYALAGNAASVLANRKVAASAGSYALTGQAAGLTKRGQARAAIREAVLARLKADATVTSLVGARVYPLAVPEDGSFPALVYVLGRVRRQHSLDGPTGIAFADFAFHAVSKKATDTVAVAEAVRQIFDGFTGSLPLSGGAVTVLETVSDGENDSWDDANDGTDRGVIATPVRYRFHYREPRPSVLS